MSLHRARAIPSPRPFLRAARPLARRPARGRQGHDPLPCRAPPCRRAAPPAAGRGSPSRAARVLAARRCSVSVFSFLRARFAERSTRVQAVMLVLLGLVLTGVVTADQIA